MWDADKLSCPWHYLSVKAKIPKIEFVCSWIYYKNWEEWVKLNPRLRNQPYPSYDRVLKYAKKIEPKWRKVERKILTELSKATNLQWKKEPILCYLVGRCVPFSDPLTIHVSYKTDNEFIDVLTHELIHQLFIQNYRITEPVWNYLGKKYKNESVNTQNHIFVHAIHQHILLKLFTKKRLERELAWAQKLPAYKKSWDIVETEGHENLIKVLRFLVGKKK